MARRDRYNPGWGFGGPRYPGTFMLALQEALTKLCWQSRRWLPAAVECIDTEGREQLLGLENLYRRVRSQERLGWPELLAELLGSVPFDALEPPADLNEVADRLLVRLGPPFGLQEEENDVWCQAVVSRYVVAWLVIDSPHSMIYVTEKMVADSGQPGSHWLALALDNLRAQTPKDSFALVLEDKGLWQCKVGDPYDASRALLLDSLLPGHEERGFFVTVPVRNHLLVLPVTANAASCLPWLRDVAVKMHKELPYPVSAEVFWVRQGNWHRIAIDLRGPHVTVSPPPELIEILESLSFSPESFLEQEPPEAEDEKDE
jgi:hypothetical protein